MTMNERIREGLQDIKTGMEKLNGGPMDYYLDRMIEMSDEFFRRCSPCVVGDSVELIKTPVIDLDSGWWPARAFLCAGSRGRVVDVEYYAKSFHAGIVFDSDPDGARGVYRLSESYFRVTTRPTPTPER